MFFSIFEFNEMSLLRQRFALEVKKLPTIFMVGCDLPLGRRDSS